MRKLLGALAAFVVASSAWAGVAGAKDDELSLGTDAEVEVGGHGGRAVAVQNLFYLNNRAHGDVVADDLESSGEAEMFFDVSAGANAGTVNSDLAFWSDLASKG